MVDDARSAIAHESFTISFVASRSCSSSSRVLVKLLVFEDAPQVQQPPCKMQHARCTIRWGGRGAYNVPPLSGPTRAPHKHMQRGARRTPRTPVPPLGHAKTARRSFISHRIDHRTPHKSSCAATVTAPRLASCHPRGTRPPDTPLTKYGCDRAFRLARSRPAGRYSSPSSSTDSSSSSYSSSSSSTTTASFEDLFETDSWAP